jgi:hypothetical protein
MSLRPMVIPLNRDLISSLGRNDPDGRDIIVIQRILVSSGSERFAKDVCGSEIETVGLALCSFIDMRRKRKGKLRFLGR